jgi:hypothetical protein
MATTDMDLFLDLKEFDFERESSHDMDDDLDDNGLADNGLADNGLKHTGLDLSCLVKNSYYDNMNFDPFINNRNGGQGSLDFHANPYGPVSHSMPGIPGFDGHSSSENSQHIQEQNQLVFPPDQIDHSSAHGAEQYRDPSGMLVDGEVEEIVDSVEQGQDAHEEASEDKVLLKHEEHDSDEEFKEEDEEEGAAEEDEDDEDGQKKKKQKQRRQPYKQTRILTHWDSKSTYIYCA